MANSVLQQPGVPNSQGNWMSKPEGISSAPQGLEYLAHVEQLFVVQKRESLEIAIGWETRNKYAIKNRQGQMIFYAFEESDDCARICCGNQRGFIIHITDNTGKEVMRVTREFNECAGCCGGLCAEPGSAFSHQVKIESPPGSIIGTVSQRPSTTVSSYEVSSGGAKLIVESPGLMGMAFGSSKSFSIKTTSGAQIGEIRKKWAGLLQEMFSDADNFGVKFPIDLAIPMKASLIGATFLIDFIHFESSN